MNANDINYFRFVSRDIHPNDEMFKSAKIALPKTGQAFHYYFFSGGHIATKVQEELLSLGKVPARLSLLDFACGYGRITRYFSLMFHEVVCSDLEPSMIEFAKVKLGLDGFLSSVDLAKIKFPERKFDVVFSFSLFTHLNPEIWSSWFWALVERIADDGYFIFSTRSPEFARSQGDEFQEDDLIKFKLKNETDGRLDASIYGQTTVSRTFVNQVANERKGEVEYVKFFPAGTFDRYQDMHILRRIPRK